jgi:hypothetical protein
MAVEGNMAWQEMRNEYVACVLPCPCWSERLWRRRTATLAGVKNYASISCQPYTTGRPVFICPYVRRCGHSAD